MISLLTGPYFLSQGTGWEIRGKQSVANKGNDNRLHVLGVSYTGLMNNLRGFHMSGMWAFVRWSLSLWGSTMIPEEKSPSKLYIWEYCQFPLFLMFQSLSLIPISAEEHQWQPSSNFCFYLLCIGWAFPFQHPPTHCVIAATKSSSQSCYFTYYASQKMRKVTS